VQDIRALAEMPRLALAASGVEWTDDRLTPTRNADGSLDREFVREHTARHSTAQYREKLEASE